MLGWIGLGDGYDDLVTITLLGDPKGGKSSIVKRLAGREFSKDEMMTLGANYSFVAFNFNNRTYRLKICDVAGQESFSPIRYNYISRSDAAIIVFDLTNPNSFKNIEKWIRDYIDANRNAKTNLPILIVGNKADKIEDRKVSLSDVRAMLSIIEKNPVYASKIIGYVETSALTGENIQESFERLTQSIMIHAT